MFTSRVVSCFCSHPDNLQCDCYERGNFELAAKKVTKEKYKCSRTKYKNTVVQNRSGDLHKIFTAEEKLIWRYIVVNYDGPPYSGVVLVVDDNDIEVKVMWEQPFFLSTVGGCTLVQFKVIIVLQSESEPVTSRHCIIDPLVWDLINEELDL